MIKTVTVEEFDDAILKSGQFITFCNLIRDSNGDILSGRKTNGIITYVYPTRIIVYTSSNDKVDIYLNDIKYGKKKILGILDDAIIRLPESRIVEGSGEPVVEDNNLTNVDAESIETTDKIIEEYADEIVEENNDEIS